MIKEYLGTYKSFYQKALVIQMAMKTKNDTVGHDGMQLLSKYLEYLQGYMTRTRQHHLLPEEQL